MAVARAFDTGTLWIVTAITGVLMVAALTVLAWRAYSLGASAFATTVVLFFAGLCISPNFAVRAEVWVWPLFALALVILDLEGPILWALVPLTVLWANLHGSVALIVPTMWLNTIVSAVIRRKDLRLRIALCVILPLATLCTPFGPSLPAYALSVLHNPMKPYIAGWKPLPFSSIYVQYGYLPLIIVLVTGLVRRLWKTHAFDFALSIVVAIATLFAGRNLGLYGLAAVIPGSLSLSWALDKPPSQRWLRSALILEAVALPAAVIFFGWYGLQTGNPGVQWPGPFGSVKTLEALPGEHRLFCAEYSWCSVALGTGNIRIFLDGRTDPYPAAVWQAYGTITHAQPGWRRLLNHYDINSVIAWRGGFFESRMQTLPNWQETTATGDRCCVLFVRTFKNPAS